MFSALGACRLASSGDSQMSTNAPPLSVRQQNTKGGKDDDGEDEKAPILSCAGQPGGWCHPGETWSSRSKKTSERQSLARGTFSGGFIKPKILLTWVILHKDGVRSRVRRLSAPRTFFLLRALLTRLPGSAPERCSSKACQSNRRESRSCGGSSISSIRACPSRHCKVEGWKYKAERQGVLEDRDGQRALFPPSRPVHGASSTHSFAPRPPHTLSDDCIYAPFRHSVVILQELQVGLPFVSNHLVIYTNPMRARQKKKVRERLQNESVGRVYTLGRGSNECRRCSTSK